MIELEVYAAGVRAMDKIMELDSKLGAVGGLRYKVDSNHDIVYMEFDGDPNTNLSQIKTLFRDLGLEARFVGEIPKELRSKSKTQRLVPE